MNKNIPIIQNILKKENRYELALKLENSYYEVCTGWNDFSAINIFVNYQNYLYLNDLKDEEKQLLITLFNAFEYTDNFIRYIEFKIDNKISIPNINDTIYIFIDEAGDMDFSKKGSKYYMFNFLVKQRPFNLHEYISNYRYSLLERNLNPLNGKRLDIEAFHAHKDNKYIKNELFNIITTFDESSIKIYSYILEKQKVNPEKTDKKEEFYIKNLSYSIQRLLDKLNIEKNFIIITDRLPVNKYKSKQIRALKNGIKKYIQKNSPSIRYDIFHHCSASSVNLQIIDYISWAIFRKHERNDNFFYKKIEKYILDEENMTENRGRSYY